MCPLDPSDYDRNSSAQERAVDAVISRLNPREDEHILDIVGIGCKVTARMAALVLPGGVTGVDGSSEMIDCARRGLGLLAELTKSAI